MSIATAVKDDSSLNSLEPEEVAALFELAPFFLPVFLHGIPVTTICLQYESSIVGP